MARYFIGTSGYQYKEWDHDFYPDTVKKKGCLPYYSTQLNAVEINASFYRLPEAATFARWKDATTDDFHFVIKGSRYVTHRKRLKA